MANKEIISSLRGLIGKYNLTDEEWQTVEKTIKLLNNSDSDCISRKSAEICLTANITNMTIEEYISMVGDRLKELPSIQPKPKTGWIPVSEKLPETAFGCLVTVEEDDRNGEPQSVLYPDFVGYDGETWNDADGVPIPFEVIAWMPLPEPYKATDSEKE